MALCGSWGVGARRGGLPRRRAAERSERHEFCSMQNIPCSPSSTPPRSPCSMVATQGRHSGRKRGNARPRSFFHPPGGVCWVRATQLPRPVPQG